MRRFVLVLVVLGGLLLIPASSGAVAGPITLASTADDGTKGNGSSGTTLSISADGTRVAFVSSATNLDPSDTDVLQDVYVKDLVTGDIVLASTADDGTKANNNSYGVTISADGTRVAFLSSADNLDPTDLDLRYDVYVKDLVTGELILADTTEDGRKARGSQTFAALSADGSRVAFVSPADNLDPADPDRRNDVYVKDLVTGELILASRAEDGTKGNGGSCCGLSLSADGTRVAFDSSASNLDPGDTDHLSDVYVKDLVSGEVFVADTADDGTKGNRDSCCAVALSADGTRVAFETRASLDPADPRKDYIWDVYVKDLATGDIMLASTADDGTKGSSDSHFDVAISADGTRVAFTSYSNNLDPEPTPGGAATFVKNLLTGDLALASAAEDGRGGNGASIWVALSADGSAVAFSSSSTNFDPADTDFNQDVYVKTLPPTATRDPAPVSSWEHVRLPLIL